MAMFWFLLIFPLVFHKNCDCQEAQNLLLSTFYRNLTTKGNLIPNLYQIPLNLTTQIPAIRVVINYEDAAITNPLTLVAVKGENILNVHLPRVQTHNHKSFEYWFSSDTMCEDKKTQKQSFDKVRISVASSEPAEYRLKVKAVKDFDIEHSISADATSSEPRLYRYTFPEGVDRVTLKATSDSNICGRIMARKSICPVFDSSGMVLMNNVFFYQSFTKFAYFYVHKKQVGSDFHVIYTVYSDDSTCNTHPNITDNKYRIKNAVITIEPSEENSLIAYLPLVIYLTSILIVLFITYFHSKWLDRQENNEPSIFDGNDSEGNVIVNFVDLFTAPDLIVSHKQYEKLKVEKQSKYLNFFYFQIFGAMLPSMTTLFQNRLLRFDVMNLDACNINFLCSYELLGFHSFNAMSSASSLLVIGIINLLIVYRKKIFRYSEDKRPSVSTHGLHKRDAPKVVCILSMIALGVFWTITSSCPQSTTVHLYVYTIVWVCLSAMMWIYSKRHGIRRWQQTFIIIVSSILAVFTYSEKNLPTGPFGTFVSKLLLGIFSFLVTLFFCYKYCYERPSGLKEHEWIQSPFDFGEKLLSDEKGIYHPLKSKKVFAIILLTWTFTWAIVIALCSSNFTQTKTVIRLVETDLIIYLFYYLIQKIRFESKSFKISYILVLVALLALFILSVAFWGSNIAWLNPSFIPWSAARSRELNSECLFPGIDWNSILHYNSSLICIAFILLMDFVDTNIKGVPKKHIFVF